MLAEIVADAQALAGIAVPDRTGPRAALHVALHYDSFAVTSLQRLRQACRDRGIPAVGHLARVVQTAMHGIELTKDVHLGTGVWFIHPLGIVIGGNTRVGDRVRFFGNNTLGQAKEDGYPTIEDDVWIGAGARILGPITVGARSRIGANAVVLTDVPPDSVAVGVPARILRRPAGTQEAP